MLDLLFFLILGHFLGDFAFQSDWVANHKKNSTAILTRHVLIYTLTVSLFLCLGLVLRQSEQFYTLTTLVVVALIFIEHWLQDFAKGRWFSTSNQGFYADQALHIIVLFVIRIYVFND